MARPREPILDKFMVKFRINTKTGCWEWTAGKAGRYGAIRDETTKNDLAHRVSYKIHRGPIPAGKRVCHQCDNPICVNPDHLFLGSDADNVADKVSKSRQARGSGHGCSKLTEADVVEILECRGTTQQVLADIYGVDRSLIGRIRNNKIWAHLPRPPNPSDLL